MSMSELGLQSTIVGKSVVISDGRGKIHCFPLEECFPTITGAPGVDGAPGVEGEPGSDGQPGTPGLDGAPGTPGAPGLNGDTGAQGAPGQDGTPGVPGDPGAGGSQGIPGTPGQDGAPGTPGDAGIQGSIGPIGPTGETGMPGIDGQPGLPGDPGAKGDAGDPGPPGDPGASGAPGATGAPGTPGTPAVDKDILCENEDGTYTSIDPVLNTETNRLECRIPFKRPACSNDPLKTTCEQSGANIATSIASGPENITQQSLGGGQLGTGEYGGTGYNSLQSLVASNNVLSIPVPAHTAGCKLFLQLSGGQITGTGFPANAPVMNGSSLQFQLIATQDSQSTSGNPNSDIFQYVYCADGNGSGAGTFDIEFPDLDPFNASDLIMWEWQEVCASNQDMASSDFNFSMIYQDTLNPTADQPFQTVQSDPFATDCGGLLFMAGRHVSFDQASNPDATNYPHDWAESSEGDTTYSTISLNSFACQAGVASAFTPGGTDTWSYTANAPTGFQAGWDESALMTLLPLSCENELVPALETVGDCKLTLVSDLCDPANARCEVDIDVPYSLGPGAVATITPIIDGQATGNVTTLAGSGTANVVVSHDAGVIVPGQVADCSMQFQIRITGGAGSVTWPDYEVCFRTV